MDNLSLWVPDYSQDIWPPRNVINSNKLETFPLSQGLEETPRCLKLRRILYDRDRACSSRLAVWIVDKTYLWILFVLGIDNQSAFDKFVQNHSIVHPKSYFLVNKEYPLSYNNPQIRLRFMA